MVYKLIFHADAIADIKDNFLWYEEQLDGLGLQLLEELEECFANLSTSPTLYSQINKRFRRIKAERFPFLIIYEIEDDVVIINAVRHTSRKPKW